MNRLDETLPLTVSLIVSRIHQNLHSKGDFPRCKIFYLSQWNYIVEPKSCIREDTWKEVSNSNNSTN